jgi:hypothetical protein
MYIQIQRPRPSRVVAATVAATIDGATIDGATHVGASFSGRGDATNVSISTSSGSHARVLTSTVRDARANDDARKDVTRDRAT